MTIQISVLGPQVQPPVVVPANRARNYRRWAATSYLWACPYVERTKKTTLALAHSSLRVIDSAVAIGTLSLVMSCSDAELPLQRLSCARATLVCLPEGVWYSNANACKPLLPLGRLRPQPFATVTDVHGIEASGLWGTYRGGAGRRIRSPSSAYGFVSKSVYSIPFTGPSREPPVVYYCLHERCDELGLQHGPLRAVKVWCTKICGRVRRPGLALDSLRSEELYPLVRPGLPPAPLTQVDTDSLCDRTHQLYLSLIGKDEGQRHSEAGTGPKDPWAATPST